MELSKAIEMVEDWLAESTYGYRIYKVEETENTWKIYFHEYEPLGSVECSTFFEVPLEGSSITNEYGDDVLLLGRGAYSYDKKMQEWFDAFEKKWSYDNKKKKVKVFYTKRIEVEVELEQKDINKFAVDGPPDWVTEMANEIDNEQPLEVEGFKVEEGE